AKCKRGAVRADYVGRALHPEEWNGHCEQLTCIRVRGDLTLEWWEAVGVIDYHHCCGPGLLAKDRACHARACTALNHYDLAGDPRVNIFLWIAAQADRSSGSTKHHELETLGRWPTGIICIQGGDGGCRCPRHCGQAEIGCTVKGFPCTGGGCDSFDASARRSQHIRNVPGVAG